MKILLVMPTWTEDLGMFSKIGRTRNPQVPLGLLYLATLAEDKGHFVRFVDCDVEKASTKDIAERVEKEKFDLVGLSATSPIFHKLVKTADAIKERCPDVVTIGGGDHINIYKKEVLFDTLDFLAFGESEETWPEFLDRLESGSKDFADIDGLIWRKDGEVVENKPRRLLPDMNKLPMPAIHLTQQEKYTLSFATPKFRKTGKYVSIMMTRGCPFKCTFCGESNDVKYPGLKVPVRFRTPENIVAEIEHHYKTHNVRHFFFMDSNITLNRNHARKLCNLLIEKNMPVTFEGWTRANLINDEMMGLLAKAGVIRMSFGIESGDPEIMKIIKKEVEHKDIRNAFMLLGKYGIEPACSAMLGNPGETKKTVRRTIEFINSIPQILYSNFSISNPYPGTEMLAWARAGKHGLRLRYDDFSKYTRYDDSPIEVNDLTAKDLVRYQALGLIKIHMKPYRILAAIRMLGMWDLVPIFINMLRKAGSNLSETMRVMLPLTDKRPRMDW